MYTIIEDCSPYYIRFTHENLDKIVDLCKQELANVTLEKTFTHYKFNSILSQQILELTPLAKQFPLKEYRVSLFITSGGRYYRAHKDGIDNRVSFNYTIQVLDDKCVTNWYSDVDLKDYSLVGLEWASPSRECLEFNKTNHTPLKSMTALPSECILFNTDIFHDWDNSRSNNVRAVLTLRIENQSNYTFDKVKQTLFGI